METAAGLVVLPAALAWGVAYGLLVGLSHPEPPDLIDWDDDDDWDDDEVVGLADAADELLDRR